jgi:hypothetical protein
MRKQVIRNAGTFSLSRTAQLIGVSEHVVQSDLSGASEFVFAYVAVDDGTPPLIQTTNDNACRCISISSSKLHIVQRLTLEFGRSDDLDGHHWLEDDRFGSRIGFTERADRAITERQL